jgi:hypothetical protein
MFGEISKAFGKTFLIACFAPVSLLTAANVVLIRHHLVSKTWLADWHGFGFDKSLALGVATLVGATALFFLGSWVYRLFEGYSRGQCGIFGILALGMGLAGAKYGVLRPEVASLASTVGSLLLLVWLMHFILQAYRRRRFTTERDRLEARPANDAARGKAMRELIKAYPGERDLVLPTRLGNMIRAFEHHPYALYRIDPISGWARLISQIPDGFASQIEDAKMGVTIRLNVTVVLGLLALELWFINSVTPRPWLPLAAAICIVSSYGSYRSSFAPAMAWGEYVRSAFDLYRLDVLKQLGIEMPTGPFTIQQERDIWQVVQYATYYVTDPGDRLKFTVPPRGTEKHPPTAHAVFE